MPPTETSTGTERTRRYLVIAAEEAVEHEMFRARFLLSGWSDQQVLSSPLHPEPADVAAKPGAALLIAPQDGVDSELVRQWASSTSRLVVVGPTDVPGVHSLPRDVPTTDLLDVLADPVPPEYVSDVSRPPTTLDPNPYQSVFEQAGDAILLMDPSTHRIVDANQRAAELYGYARDALLGRSMLDLVPTEEHPKMLKNTQHLRETGGRNTVSRTHLKRDRSPMRVTVSAALVPYGDQLVFQDIVRDESARLELEEALRKQTHTLRQLNQRLEQEISQRREAEEEARRLALYDELTGLPNRRLFTEQCTHALAAGTRRNAMQALLFMDLDGFKAVNDAAGHPVGDAVLQEFARRLQRLTRASDCIARWSGDEFCIFVDDLHSREQAGDAAQRILDSLRQPIELDGSSHDVGVSIGVALTPRDGLTLDDLIERADAAMYRVKATGKNDYAFATPH